MADFDKLVERLRELGALPGAVPISPDTEVHSELHEAAAAIQTLQSRLAESEAREAVLVEDFRWRASQCRTNRDAYCPTAASVWDTAADVIEGKAR